MELLLPIVIFIFFLFLFLRLLGTTQTTTKLPPGPRPWPVVGNLFHLFFLLRGKRMGENKERQHLPFHQALASLSNTYGPLTHLRLGTQQLIVVSSSIAAAEILKTHDKIFSFRHVPSAYRISFYSDHSLAWSTSCDDQWKTQRSLCRRQLFSPKPLESGAAARERKAREMVENVSTGEEVRISDLVFRTLYEILGNAIFSRDVFDLYGGDQKKDMNKGLEIGSAPNLEDFFVGLFGGFDPQGLRKETVGIIKKSYDQWDQIVKERKQREGEKNDDLLELLLSSGFEGFKLNALLSDIFTAGTDTTTHSVEWTMAELMKNPDIMQNLKAELRQALRQARPGSNSESDWLKESDVVNLPYLQSCVKESLRLHPPTPLLLPHLASATCHNVLGKYVVPEGSVVIVNAWAIGRDPTDWVDPLVYSPERFLSRKDDDREFELMAFGAGRRMCPGMMLAYRMVGLFVASLVHEFDWELPGGMEADELCMEEKPGLLLERKEPLILVPTKIRRSSSSQFN